MKWKESDWDEPWMEWDLWGKYQPGISDPDTVPCNRADYCAGKDADDTEWNTIFSFPVGKVDIKTLCPMGMEEFMIAVRRTQFWQAKGGMTDTDQSQNGE